MKLLQWNMDLLKMLICPLKNRDFSIAITRGYMEMAMLFFLVVEYKCTCCNSVCGCCCCCCSGHFSCSAQSHDGKARL